MSIYIKNLEAMPCCEFCGFCRPYRGDPFSDGIWCNAVNKLITLKAGICTPKPDWCPVIEIQEPHGRIIDADEFLKRAIGTKCFRDDFALMLEELVGESTTIIQASEES